MLDFDKGKEMEAATQSITANPDLNAVKDEKPPLAIPETKVDVNSSKHALPENPQSQDEPISEIKTEEGGQSQDEPKGGTEEEVLEEGAFDGFSFDEPKGEEGTPEEEGAKAPDESTINDMQQYESVLSEIGNKLGLSDLKSTDDLVQTINDLRAETQRVQEPVFANDEIKDHFDTINELAKNGSDWRKYQENSDKIAQIETSIKSHTDHLDSVSHHYQEDPKALIEWHYEARMQLKGERLQAAKEELENMSPVELTKEAYSVMNSERSLANSEISRLAVQKNSMVDEQSKATASAQRNAELARKEIETAISSYKDEHGAVFTKQAQKIAKQAFSTEQIYGSFPQGVMEQLVLTNGRFDAGKAMKAMSLMNLSEKKINFLMKQVKNESKKEQFEKGASYVQNGNHRGIPGKSEFKPNQTMQKGSLSF